MTKIKPVFLKNSKKNTNFAPVKETKKECLGNKIAEAIKKRHIEIRAFAFVRLVPNLENSHVLNDGKGQDARTHRCGLDCISV